MSRMAAVVFAIVLCGSAASADEMDIRAESILREGLENRNPDSRKQAVAALSLAATREPYLTRLIGMLEDKDVEVRLVAVSSVSEIKNRAVRTALRKTLQDEVPEVSFAAAKALWSLRDPMGKQALMAVLEGENKTSSGFLSKQKREALRMMHTPRAALMFAARQAAGFAPIPGLGGGISSMQSILTDPAVSGRAAAALLVGAQNDAATIQALKDALKADDASLRAAAVHSLALKNNSAFRKDIVPLLVDDKESVRLRAAAAVARLAAIRSKRASANSSAPATAQTPSQQARK